MKTAGRHLAKGLRYMTTASMDAEEAAFKAACANVEKWWQEPRWKGVVRPYSASDVVMKSGTLEQSYASSTQAKKLWNLIQTHGSEKQPLHTMGAIDPVQMTQMAPFQKVLYVSGWACSSVLTTTNEVSPDMADYPYNTVPNQVQRLFKAQQLHDRRAYDAWRSMPFHERSKTSFVDYLRPIIADADAGHGGLTSVMKVAKLFAENGAAAIHMEDQMHGGKKCGHQAGKVVVPTSEHVNRLIASRLQWDIMRCDNLLIARTDADSAKLISSSVDGRDHEFILGIHKPSKPMAEALYEAEMDNAPSSRINEIEKKWLDANKLCTFDEAVEMALQKSSRESQFSKYKAAVKGKTIWDARQIAREFVGAEVFFDWDAPRTREGYYQFAGGLEAATKRVQAFAPYSDLLWLETKTPNLKEASGFASKLRASHPEKYLVYNLSPSFNWSAHGFSDSDLKNFLWDLAKEGFVLQLVSLAGLHSGAAITRELAQRFESEGMFAYVDVVQRREKEVGTDVLTHQKW